MWKKVHDYMNQYHMLKPGERVIAAISGGADSVCLLSVLNQICRRSPELSWQILAVHVHHGLRGEEADRDAAFVKALCARLEIPCEVVYRDVSSYAAVHGHSLEEAGRILRYQVLAEQAAKWPDSRIALAHHKDDNAETILHHLLRGSALRGLGGMRPVQGNRIRPLLATGRAEIIDYLNGQGIDWVEDSTNASGAYTRNRIRHEVMPLLTTAVNKRAADHILQAGALFTQVDEYFEGIAEQVLKALSPGLTNHEPGNPVSTAVIPLAVLKAQHPLVRSYLFGHMIAAVLPARRDITARHYAAMEGLLHQSVGSRICLHGDTEVIRDYEQLRVIRHASGPADVKAPPAKLQMETFLRKKDVEIPRNKYTKWFDYDKIRGALSVRTRQTGDYFMLTNGSRKMVNRYMIDEKIPASLREQILLLAEDDHVLWIVGYRVSEYYKVTEATTTILQVRCDEGEYYGR